MKCRHCDSDLRLPLIDLGSAPPSNAYLSERSLHLPEKWYPLRVLVCTKCWLAQTEDFAGREDLFTPEYAYFSSFSTTWLAHAERYVATMQERFSLNADSHVVEIAANDGYLLQFVKAKHIPCTGVEPTASTARAAREKGIPIVEDFFGIRLAKKLASGGKQADLITANNVLAHVPDINDFVAGFAVLLKPHGVATLEFPHLLRLIQENQFDTIYHEHFSYLSLTAVTTIFASNGLHVFDVEELPTHGGSLRVFAQRSDSGEQPISPRVAKIHACEGGAGMTSTAFYEGLQQRAEKIKYDLLSFLIEGRRQGKRIAAYGAAAKGNTLLNYAGIRSDLISFVVDRNPAKQGKFMPGSRIPIVGEDMIRQFRPDVVLILPWNLHQEIGRQLCYVREWGGQLIVVVPVRETL